MNQLTRVEPATYPLVELLSGERKARLLQRTIPRRAAYVVRDRDRVFYVGSTGSGCGVSLRLRQHIYKRSDLGRAIADDPRSASWVVDVYPADTRACALALEADLIRELAPTVNVRRLA